MKLLTFKISHRLSLWTREATLSAGCSSQTNMNLSVSLVEEGLSKVHFTAEKSNYYQTLLNAEAKAKKNKANVSHLDL